MTCHSGYSFLQDIGCSKSDVLRCRGNFTEAGRKWCTSGKATLILMPVTICLGEVIFNQRVRRVAGGCCVLTAEIQVVIFVCASHVVGFGLPLRVGEEIPPRPSSQ